MKPGRDSDTDAQAEGREVEPERPKRPKFSADDRRYFANEFVRLKHGRKKSAAAEIARIRSRLDKVEWAAERLSLQSTDSPEVDAAKRFVWMLECILSEVRKPRRSKKESTTKFERLRKALAKVSQEVLELTGAEAMALVAGTARHLERVEVSRIEGDPRTAMMRQSGLFTHEQMSPESSAKRNVRNQLAKLSTGPLKEAEEWPRDWRRADVSAESLARLGETLAMLANGAERAPYAMLAAGLKAQAAIASRIVEVFASHELPHGGRLGLASTVMEAALGATGIGTPECSPGRLIEEAAKHHRKRAENCPPESVAP